jgi:hypothetical protein
METAASTPQQSRNVCRPDWRRRFLLFLTAAEPAVLLLPPLIISLLLQFLFLPLSLLLVLSFVFLLLLTMLLPL